MSRATPLCEIAWSPPHLKAWPATSPPGHGPQLRACPRGPQLPIAHRPSRLPVESECRYHAGAHADL